MNRTDGKTREAAGAAVRVRKLATDDAPALLLFYNSVGSATIRTFRPLGTSTSAEVCQRIVDDSTRPSASRIDLVAYRDGRVVGWAFVAPLAPGHLDLGVCVADDYQGRGVGTALLEETLATAKLRAMSPVYLMVVKDNDRARRWYERNGFTVCGDEFDEADQLHYFHMVSNLSA